MKTNTLSTFVLVTCASCIATHSAEKDGFAFEQKDDRLIMTHAGKPVAHYVFKDANILRPYFARVCAPDGIQVTRSHPPVAGNDPADHDTMHPGIWMAFGDISGQDFWRNKAAIRHERFVDAPSVHDGRLTFGTESTMLATNDGPLARLVSHFTLRSQKDGYLLVWHAALTPLTDGFAFGDQEEMGFGVRVATPITEKNGGLVQSSDGVKSAKVAWGKIANWCDYAGTISNRIVGVTVIPDPKNFRPSWFHSRDYGLIVANPFGRNAFTKSEPSSVRVTKGSTFQLRFAAFVHSTPANEPPDIANAFAAFTNQE